MALPRVATVGYGFLGKWHAQKAQALSALCDFRAIVERHPPAQEAARAAHPGVKVVGELSEVIDDIDAAVVVTPTSLHHAVVQSLLLAGKHVFCEKPLCSTAAQARELEKTAADKGLLLQVGHSERCHAAWERLRPLFLATRGPFDLRIDRFAPFKGRATDVDVVQDLMIHDIDLMLWLFGRRPLEVRALRHKIRTRVWDHVTAQFTLEGGAQAILTMGRNHTHEVRALEVMGATGLVRVDLMANKILEAPAGEVSPGVFVKEETYAKRDHLLIEQEAFYRSIATGAPLMVTPAEGRRAVELVEAVLEAAASGRAVPLRA
jgi:predicted dehydrogenase